MNKILSTLVISLLLITSCMEQSENNNGQKALYQYNENVETRWASFENLKSEKGQGGKAGNGAKGYPYHLLQKGETVTILEVDGPGIIHRIWMTVDKLFYIPEEARSIRIDMYWDGSKKPAVSAPLEDFFNQTFGKMRPFDSELFSSPEGRSLVCFVPMPFKKGAKITLTNESPKRNHRIFYDINFSKLNKAADDMLYFHAHWRRENLTKLGRDFEILPKVEGKGRFLGTNIGVIANSQYEGWWGEGEVKVYLDGDKQYPTLVGTGTEDYIASGFSQAEFSTRYSGCLIADSEKNIFSLYRYHVPDPVWFHKDIRVTIQQMGGGAKHLVKKMISRGLAVEPVCYINKGNEQLNFSDKQYSFEDDSYPKDIWTNYYREDDVCATAWFYLDNPENELPALPSFAERR